MSIHWLGLPQQGLRRPLPETGSCSTSGQEASGAQEGKGLVEVSQPPVSMP